VPSRSFRSAQPEEAAGRFQGLILNSKFEEDKRMNFRGLYVTAILGSLLLGPANSAARAVAGSGITVPAGTTVSTLKYGDTAGTVVHLKPEEQVAFLFVYGIEELESTCVSTFFGGPGRLCSLSELVQG